MWLPLTVNCPGPVWVTVPGLVELSPQLMVVEPPPVVKSAVVAPRFWSVKVARVLLTGLVETKLGLPVAPRP